VFWAPVSRLANLRIALAGLMVLALALALAFTAFGPRGGGASVRSSRSAPGSRAAGAAASGPVPPLGVVGASEPNFAPEAAAGVHSVTISVVWNEAEPDSGTFSTSYIQGVNDEIAAA